MPSDQDRGHREVEPRRQLFPPRRARLEPDRQAAEHVDQVAVETGPVPRQSGSLFEPDQSESVSTMMAPIIGGDPLPVTPSETPPRRRWAWLLIVPAVTLAVGMMLGVALGSGRVGLEPTSAPAVRPPSTQLAPVPVTSVVVRPTASSACLETARRADEIIQLLVTNRRRRAAELLVAYTVASRQCRRDASP